MKKILIVDDQLNSTESIAIGLRKYGYYAESANSGKEGLLKVKNGKFDYVLCDINMPEMDGWEFANKAKAFTSADFIFITADSRTNKKTEFSSYSLLIKPIELSSIIELLNGKKGV